MQTGTSGDGGRASDCNARVENRQKVLNPILLELTRDHVGPQLGARAVDAETGRGAGALRDHLTCKEWRNNRPVN